MVNSWVHYKRDNRYFRYRKISKIIRTEILDNGNWVFYDVCASREFVAPTFKEVLNAKEGET